MRGPTRQAACLGAGAVVYCRRLGLGATCAGREGWTVDLLSPVHLVIILAIALLLFGPKRLPEIGQGLGKTIREFRHAMKEGGDDKPVVPAPDKDEQLH